MKIFKVKKFYLSVLPIDKNIIDKLEDKMCYLTLGLAGGYVIYQEEKNEYIPKVRFVSEELDKLLVFLNNAEEISI